MVSCPSSRQQQVLTCMHSDVQRWLALLQQICYGDVSRQQFRQFVHIWRIDLPPVKQRCWVWAFLSFKHIRERCMIGFKRRKSSHTNLVEINVIFLKKRQKHMLQWRLKGVFFSINDSCIKIKTIFCFHRVNDAWRWLPWVRQEWSRVPIGHVCCASLFGILQWGEWGHQLGVEQLPWPSTLANKGEIF